MKHLLFNIKVQLLPKMLQILGNSFHVACSMKDVVIMQSWSMHTGKVIHEKLKENACIVFKYSNGVAFLLLQRIFSFIFIIFMIT